MKLSAKIPVLLLVFASSFVYGQEYQLASPDKKIAVTISVANQLNWSAKYNGESILLPSNIALILSDGKTLATKPLVSKAIPSSIKSVITAAVPVKQKLIPEEYNQLILQCKGSYSVVFRAYNDGIAYRFVTAFADSVTVMNETADLNFPDNYQTAWPFDEPFSFAAMRPAPNGPAGFGSANPPSSGAGIFGPPPPPNTNQGNNTVSGRSGAPAGPPPSFLRMLRSPYTNSFEYLFRDSLIASVKDTVGLPVYMSTSKGVKLVFTESDLHDYPNLFAVGTGKNSITAAFPPYVLKAGGSMGFPSPPAETANYIARTNGKRNYPWRVLVVSPDDKGLLENQLVYKLATPSVIPTDWIEPGQVSWEWWHASNLFNVDFKAGINTASYKYYIDFAAKYGIKYILIDAGWSKNPQVDVPAITSYGKSKNVGVMLWMSWTDLTANMPATLDEFETWGVKGVKMDYMNRADQKMVNIFERVAEETAKRHMLIDFHGAYKPSGLNRKYPNVINYEGVKGMEHNKLGSMRITPSHDVTLLFTRMVTGPMDYTPGAMHNTSSNNFRNILSEPMSQGTRAHQAAMYIMYDAPIQMLADNPVLYMSEDSYTKFLTQIPTIWDTTIGIDGKIGQFAVMARRNGQRWFLGALGDWASRTLDIKTDFLAAGRHYKISIVADGVNADNYAADYTLQSTTITGGEPVKISLMPGGGWAAIITPTD